MKSRSGPYFLVGLTGNAGAGRRSCARILVSAHAFGVLSLESLVDAEVAAAFGVDQRLFSDRTLRAIATSELALRRCADLRFVDLMMSLRPGITYDQALSPARVASMWELGYRLAYDGVGYWLARAHERVEQMHREGWRRIVVPHVSLVEESVFLRQMGGEIWRVRNPEVDLAASVVGEQLYLGSIRADREVVNEGTGTGFVYDVLHAYSQATSSQHSPASPAAVAAQALEQISHGKE